MVVKVLELFCGTKSVGKCCEELGWEVVSVDINNKYNPTHCVDILNFDYKQYKDFDVIWASPDCRYYSKLQNTWLGKKKKNGVMTTYETIEEDRKKSDKLIEKTFEIINYFKPHLWFIENPISCLKDRDVMKDVPFYDVDYCKYSDWGYKKRTRIWTNKKDFKPLICNKDCDNMVQYINPEYITDGEPDEFLMEQNNYHNVVQWKHRASIGIGKLATIQGQESVKGGGSNRDTRYRIPEDLIYSLLID